MNKTELKLYYNQKKLKTNRIIFSPEFLRDSHELNDNIYPSRIIIGNEHILSKEFSILLKQLVKQVTRLEKAMQLQKE